MDSILTSIKKLLGPSAEDTHFDPDIIMHINTVLAILTQVGVGPASGFAIEDDTAVWSDFIGDDPRLSFVKTYVYLKVKLVFDPSLSSAVMDAIKTSIAELEWRLFVAVDPPASSN